jgi:hypothetical protein
MSADSERYVCLKDGPIVPVAPILLLLDLEAKGFRLERDGNDILIHPASKLSDEDREQLKLWKAHVLAMLDYIPTAVAQ